MLYLDLPTLPELRALHAARAAACVSLYLPTTPVTEDAQADRGTLRALAREATGPLEGRLDKRALAALTDNLDELLEDDAFWAYQAHSLAVLATPDSLRTYRLPNRLSAQAEVSDRFHLKPLLRAVTYPFAAFVLQLDQETARLWEIAADLPPEEIRVPAMPESAASLAGRAALSRSPRRRVQGAEGKRLRLEQYARAVDTALRPVLAGRDTPLLLVASSPLDAMFRARTSYPHLLPGALAGVTPASPGHEMVAPVAAALAAHHAAETQTLLAAWGDREAAGRASGEVTTVARAATFGFVETLLVNMDASLPGIVDPGDGTTTFADAPGPDSYDILDEIAGRALVTGARVLAVRADDLPGPAPLAAFLRRRA